MSLLNYTGPIASRGISYHGRGENIGLLDRDLLLFGLDSMEFFFFELRICIFIYSMEMERRFEDQRFDKRDNFL